MREELGRGKMVTRQMKRAWNFEEKLKRERERKVGYRELVYEK